MNQNKYHADMLKQALSQSEESFVNTKCSGANAINLPKPIVRLAIDSLKGVTRQIIRTRYLGPTNTRGTRIVAECDTKRITIAWSHDLGIEENYRAAAQQLATGLDWGEVVIGGGFKNEYFWVTA